MRDTAGAPAKTVVILGGRSEIGLELARRLALGSTVVLAARRADRLDDEVAAVRAAGATAVHTVEFDAAAGETVRFRCENGLTGGGMVMVLMMGVAYLRVRLTRI